MNLLLVILISAVVGGFFGVGPGIVAGLLTSFFLFRDWIV